MLVFRIRYWMVQQLFNSFKKQLLQPKQTNNENPHLFQTHNFRPHKQAKMEYTKYQDFKFIQLSWSIVKIIYYNLLYISLIPNPNPELLEEFNYFHTKVSKQDNF